MRQFHDRPKKIATAFLLSAFIAGAISMPVNPVAANKAAVIADTVDRTNKADRLSRPAIAEHRQPKSVSAKPIPMQTLAGCEPAFSPLADPTRGRLLAHCMS
ncbi:MAG TPA: hypothetical protein VFP60_09320 [Pseudolabrys sp.]|nr:hypothetical protein [Pseudolabrys sp.]